MKLSEILHKLLLNYMEQNGRIGHLKTESSFFKDHPNMYIYIYIHTHTHTHIFIVYNIYIIIRACLSIYTFT